MTKTTSDWLPVSAPVLQPEDAAAVADSLRSGWISSAGPAIEAFENQWAHYCGATYGVAMSSGTAALQVAIDCLELEVGDEVILPGLTIISCALAIVRAGATPVVVDCTAGNYLIDPAAVAAAITPRTRAIMAVHLFGHPVDMAALWRLADKHGLVIIEDAAQAHGAEYYDAVRSQWRRCGSLGKLAVFSFYANKPVTTGEGGMLLTDDVNVATRARSLRNLAFGQPERFRHELLGYNFRMTNPQAALGLSQVQRIDAILRSRQQIRHYYDELFSDCTSVVLQTQEAWAKSICWMYPLVIRPEVGMTADELARRLAQRGIETRPFFLGLHQQPALRQLGLFVDISLPITDALYQRGLYVPSSSDLTQSQQARVVAAIKDILR